MFVGNRYESQRFAEGIRDFCCPYCKYSGKAYVLGKGRGSGMSPYMLNERGAAQTASNRAQKAAQKNIDTTIKIASCPQCGLKNKDAVRSFWNKALGKATLLAVGVYLFLVVFMYIFTGQEEEFFWPTQIFGFSVGIILMLTTLLGDERPKLTGADKRVQFLDPNDPALRPKRESTLPFE